MPQTFRYSIKIIFYFILLFAVLEVLGVGRVKIQIKFAVITISWMIMIYGVIKYQLIQNNPFHVTDKLIIGTFLIWCIINIFRSANIPLNNHATIPRYLGDPLFTSAALVPFFVYYGCRSIIWKEVWKLALSFVRLFLVLSPLLFIYTRQYIHLSLFIPFLVMSWDKLNQRDKFITILSFIVACIYSVLNSERNLLVHFLFFPFAYYLIIVFNKVPNQLSKFFQLSFLLIVSASILTLMYTGYISQFITDPVFKNNIQGFEAENFNSTTHNLVFEDFFTDFNHTRDLFLGRGVLGYTYSEQFLTIQEMTDTEKNIFNLPIGYRTEVECGYLMFILKSGLFGLILFLIIATRAIFLGIFYSTNVFTKCCALLIIEWLIIMYPFGWPEYTISYILIWLAIGACLNKKMRLYSNKQINALIYTQQK